jgi:hypothetical protein
VIITYQVLSLNFAWISINGYCLSFTNKRSSIASSLVIFFNISTNHGCAFEIVSLSIAVARRFAYKSLRLSSCPAKRRASAVGQAINNGGSTMFSGGTFFNFSETVVLINSSIFSYHHTTNLSGANAILTVFATVCNDFPSSCAAG